MLIDGAYNFSCGRTQKRPIGETKKRGFLPRFFIQAVYLIERAAMATFRPFRNRIKPQRRHLEPDAITSPDVLWFLLRLLDNS